MSHNSVSINLGDTIKASCVYRDSNGDPVNLTAAGITVTSAIRNPDGTKEFDLEVTPAADQVANAGQFLIRGQSAEFASRQTAGTWTWLIRYTQGEDVFSTERIKVVIE